METKTPTAPAFKTRVAARAFARIQAAADKAAAAPLPAKGRARVEAALAQGARLESRVSTGPKRTRTARGFRVEEVTVYHGVTLIFADGTEEKVNGNINLNGLPLTRVTRPH